MRMVDTRMATSAGSKTTRITLASKERHAVADSPLKKRKKKSSLETKRVSLTDDASSSANAAEEEGLQGSRTAQLTALQANMKHSLDGARFR